MKVVFFTGAGISKESGLDTFRDAGGIWDQYDPQEVCSSRGLNKNRAAVLEFHNKVRVAIDAVEPNAAHKAIAELEKHCNVAIVTQNIDNLHERAGSTNVVKVHGDIYKAQLKRYKDPVIPWSNDILTDSFPEGFPQCKGTLRHDVVLFGENVKKGKIAQELISSADFLVVVGTSLTVYPAAGWILNSRALNQVLIDPYPAAGEFYFTKVIEKTAVEGIAEVVDLIKKELC